MVAEPSILILSVMAPPMVVEPANADISVISLLNDLLAMATAEASENL